MSKKDTKQSIQDMSAREIGKQFLDELKAQGPKKANKGNVYIMRSTKR